MLKTQLDMALLLITLLEHVARLEVPASLSHSVEGKGGRDKLRK